MSAKFCREFVRHDPGPVLQEETLSGRFLIRFCFTPHHLSSSSLHYQQLVKALPVTLQHTGFLSLSAKD